MYLKQFKNGALPKFRYGIDDYTNLVYRPSNTVGFAPEIEEGYTNRAPIYRRPVAPLPDKQASPVPEISIPQSEAIQTLTGSNKPNWFGKIKGVLGGLKGGSIDLENIIPTISGLGIANRQYAEASGPIRTPNIYASNAYENAALSKLAGLKSDYYPIWAQLREQEGRGKNAILQSGGLGAGQRALAFMGLTNQTQQNGMNALFEHQNRQNALDAQWANAALQTGAQTAARQMQANQFNEDMLAKAHNAQLYGKQMAMYNGQNALEQYFANKFKKQQFDDTMSLYRDNQKIETEKLKTMLDNLNNTGDYKYESTGVPGNAAMPTLDPKTGSFVGKNPFVEAAMKLSPNTSNMSGYVNGAASILKNLGVPLTKAESTQIVKPRVKRNTKKTKGGKK